MKTLLFKSLFYLLFLSSPVLFAQNPSISMIGPSGGTVSGLTGTQFTIDIKVGDPTAVSNLNGVSFNLTWDNTTFIQGYSASAGSYWGSNPLFISQIFTDHFEIGVSSSTGGYSGSGIIASCVLEVKQDVTSNTPVNFNLTNITALDGNGNSVTLNPENNPIIITLTGGQQNFSLNVSPNSRTITPGSNANFTIDILRTNFPDPITFSASPSDPDIMYDFNPNPVSANQTNFTISTTTNINDGRYVLDISGIGGQITHTVKCTLDVQSSTNPSIKMIGPGGGIVNGHAGTQFTIDIKVGDPTVVSNLNGVSFDLTWDNTTFIQGNSASAGSFWGSNPLFISQIFTDHFEIGVSSSTGGYSGSGIIASCVLEVKQDVTTNTPVNFNLTNITALDGNGNSVTLNPENNPLIIQLDIIDEIYVDIPDDLTGATDENISIPINVGDLTGLEVYSYQGIVTFDSNVLEARSPFADNSGTISANWPQPQASSPNATTINFGGFGTTPLSGSGTIVNLLFTVVGSPGSSTSIDFSNFIFNAGNPVANTSSGLFTVRENTFDIDGIVNYCITGNPLSSALLDLNGASTSSYTTGNDGLYAFNDLLGNLNYIITPSKTNGIGFLSIGMFDASLIARNWAQLIPLNTCQQWAADVDKDGQILMYDAACVATYVVSNQPLLNSHVGEWEFDPQNYNYEPLNSDMPNQDFTSVLLGDVDGNWTPASEILQKSAGILDNSPVASAIIIAAGEELCIPFFIGNDQEVYSVYFEMTYPSILQEKEVRLTSLSEKFQLVKNLDTKGQLKVGLYSTDPISESGIIAEVIFTVSADPDENFNLNLDKYQVNNQPIQSTQINIKFSSKEQASINTYSLEQNYPNPFNPSTTIRYSLNNKETRLTEIHIYTVSGQKIRTLVNQDQKSGNYTVIWDGLDDYGREVSSGIYFYQLKSNNYIQTRKLLKMK